MVSLDPIIDKLFAEALQRGASDIHLEPVENGLQVRWRVQGKLLDGPRIEIALKESLVAKLKLMAKLDSTQSAIPQDGAMVIKGVAVRLSTIPVLGGQSVVLRLLQRVEKLSHLPGLGLRQKEESGFAGALKRSQGLILIVGPTGSGKTTTFYAALRLLDPAAQKIVTVEDPVEQPLEGICQVPVKGELNFATALRSILRQAPNVIGVGELRDRESAAMALQAALTGHLVVATLHAEGAAAAIIRLVDMGLDRVIISEVLSGVLAQRLITVRQSDGTALRKGIFEWMDADEEIADAIKRQQSTLQLRSILEKRGFQSLYAQAKELVQNGFMTPEALAGEFMET